MRIIHCADLHLDSKMTANLDKERAKERKAEILLTFEHMVQYADEQGVSAILIAGDLFDTKNVSATTRHAVERAIVDHPGITFYYLRGNHDVDNFLSSLEEVPANLKLFAEEWTTYPLNEAGTITLSGLELTEANSLTAYHSLILDVDHLNIVTLHGQESQATAKDKAEVINVNALKNKGIDYLALGHIHAHKLEKLDQRGVYCYPGCLEGRGFDECGEHGFMLLDIDESAFTMTESFVPFAGRKLYEVAVDVTGCENSADIAQAIEGALGEQGIGYEHLLKIVLTGSLDVEAEMDPAYLLRRLEPNYYFVKMNDETRLKVNPTDYTLEASLKGEFVRQVLADETIAEEDKAAVIRLGLRALGKEAMGE